ncbi:MAG: efflux transporter outer membrane subunit [Rubrivivax sp.]|nr:MAG: efflux transporter outer membrane subunit [Rubrivivax sp.]
MHAMPRRASLLLLLALAGCAVGPSYQRPAFNAPLAYKEAEGWVVAVPADALDRGAWWTLFGDAELDTLAAQVEVSNQNVAAATAAYAQARALLAVQRASLFPVVSLSGGASRSRGGENGARNNFQASIGGSWEPDVWGRLRNASTSAEASAQASAADLASARLSAQGELAVAYFGLRQTDAQRALLAETLAGYERSLQIARNRYGAGIVGRTDVLQAETQLANAQADALGLERSRAQLEHAIAVLVGKTPAEFRIVAREASASRVAQVPDVPLDLPSTLLQRRPDIAAAERRVAAANAQIGIAKSAYYPSLGLNGSVGVGASAVSALGDASSLLWSLGVSAAQTLFDAGATRERVNAASAANDEAVARYRQTVLAAFQDVEDQLATTRVLKAQEALRRQAAESAELAQAQVQNRYEAGQVSYSEVVAAQATALSARRALVQLVADRQTTAVALIQSLGGGWRAPE